MRGPLALPSARPRRQISAAFVCVTVSRTVGRVGRIVWIAAHRRVRASQGGPHGVFGFLLGPIAIITNRPINRAWHRRLVHNPALVSALVLNHVEVGMGRPGQDRDRNGCQKLYFHRVPSD